VENRDAEERPDMESTKRENEETWSEILVRMLAEHLYWTLTFTSSGEPAWMCD